MLGLGLVLSGHGQALSVDQKDLQLRLFEALHEPRTLSLPLPLTLTLTLILTPTLTLALALTPTPTLILTPT